MLGWSQVASGYERSDVQAYGAPGRAALWGPEARGRAVAADGSDGYDRCSVNSGSESGNKRLVWRLTKTKPECLLGEMGLNPRVAGTTGGISKWNSAVQIACREAICWSKLTWAKAQRGAPASGPWMKLGP